MTLTAPCPSCHASDAIFAPVAPDDEGVDRSEPLPDNPHTCGDCGLVVSGDVLTVDTVIGAVPDDVPRDDDVEVVDPDEAPDVAAGDEAHTSKRVDARLARLERAQQEHKAVKAAKATGAPIPPTPAIDSLPLNRKAATIMPEKETNTDPKKAPKIRPVVVESSRSRTTGAAAAAVAAERPTVADGHALVALRSTKHVQVVNRILGTSVSGYKVRGLWLDVTVSKAPPIAKALGEWAVANRKPEYDNRLATGAYVMLHRAVPTLVADKPGSATTAINALNASLNDPEGTVTDWQATMRQDATLAWTVTDPTRDGFDGVKVMGARDIATVYGDPKPERAPRAPRAPRDPDAPKPVRTRTAKTTAAASKVASIAEQAAKRAEERKAQSDPAAAAVEPPAAGNAPKAPAPKRAPRKSTGGKATTKAAPKVQEAVAG